MKLFLPAVVVLLIAQPLLASGQTHGVHPLPAADAGLSVLPVAVDQSESRSSISLRESLRQPLDEAEAKPFRLSSRERQRLREQVRGQPLVYETSKNSSR